MRKDEDGKPTVKAGADGLGVRAGLECRRNDVDVDDLSNVVLNRKGMSVAPRWRDLPYFRIPERLKPEIPTARGKSELYCFTMGDGIFSNGPVSDRLELNVDSSAHGVVAPSSSVSIEQFQSDLAATREFWSVDEA